MKSIKEKAEERAPYTKTDSWDRIKAAINAQTSFEAGANYVLEEIEEFQKLFSTCMNAHANGYLKSVIEQLKK